MRVERLRFGHGTAIQLRGDTTATWPAPGTFVTLQLLNPGVVEVAWPGGRLRAQVWSTNREVETALAAQRASVAWIRSVSDDGAIIESRRIGTRVHVAGPLPIAVTDDDAAVLAKIVSTHGQDVSMQWACDVLNELAAVEGAPAPVFIAGFAGDDALAGFRLHAERALVDIRSVEDGGGDTTLHIARIVRSPRAQFRSPRILEANLHFVPAHDIEAIRSATRTQLQTLAQSHDSYQRVWGTYLQREFELLANRVREVGFVAYSKLDVDEQGRWWATIDIANSGSNTFSELRDRIGDGLHGGPAMLSARLPEIIRQPDLLLAEGGREELAKLRMMSADALAKPVRWDAGKNRILLAPGDLSRPAPPAPGYMYFPVVGDATRLKRRVEAQKAIQDGNTPMPQIGLLLEGARPHAVSRKVKMPTARELREAMGGDDPTPAQRRAIEVALRTPDIAVIQGPPGTGKTKVIGAIVRLIDAREPRDPGSDARILVTSTQHDAVVNASKSSTVRGVPALKIGRGAEDSLQAWVAKLVTELRERRGGLPDPASAFRTVRRKLHAALHADMRPAAMQALLREVAREGAAHAQAKHIIDLQLQIKRLSQGGAEHSPSALRRARAAAWRLYTSAESFADGGRDGAWFACCQLEGSTLLEAVEASTLQEAADLPAADLPSEDLLNRLLVLRNRLLDLGRVQSSPTQARLSGPVLAAAAAVMDDWEAAERSREPNAGEVLDELIADLQVAPEELERMVLEYTVTLAATCQHTASQKMTRYKQKAGYTAIVFDTVIIDEAARVDPLDMQIPLSQARSRIIFVGDHHQLAHMLEPLIEAELAKTANEAELEALRESLFSRLIHSARKLFAEDQHKRVVVLNEQFRMHPVLGDIVSRHFYEKPLDPDAQPIKLKAGLPPDHACFAHGLTDYKGPNHNELQCVWLDVPAKRGREEYTRPSRRRVCEAKEIARKVKAILDASDDRTVGVISFYSAQVEEIWRQLRELKIAERSDEGWQLTHPVDRTPNGDIRLRVGTVDAFQGLEFDVVFLSITRSNKWEVTDELTWPRRFGHLLSRNRRCVALSRARQLLIVAGDAEMVRDDVAAAALPDLHEIFSRCRAKEAGFALRR